LPSTWGHYSSKKANHKKIPAEGFLSEDGGKKQQQEVKIVVVLDSTKKNYLSIKTMTVIIKTGIYFEFSSLTLNYII
jgi:hypothetical protein